MTRVSLILIVLLCLGVGFWLGTATEHARLLAFLRDNIASIVAVAFGGLALVLAGTWSAVFYARRLARKMVDADRGMTDAEVVFGLVDHFTTPDGVDNPTSHERRRAALGTVGLWLARRAAVQFSFNATVTVVGGLVGGATLFLLYEQNQKLELQNHQIRLQTDATIVQSILLETTRRSTLSVGHQALFADIADAQMQIDTPCIGNGRKAACWERRYGTRQFHLPRDLYTRAQTLAQRSTPHNMAEPRDSGGGVNFDNPLSEQFRFRALSPERGQLLEILVANNVVVPLADYNFALLHNASLPEAVLRNLQLNVSDFRNANLRGADLSGSGLQEANFVGADLTQANLAAANIQGASVSTSSFADTHVSATEFTGVLVRSGRTGTAWAWRDTPPKNFPDAIELSLCPFDAAKGHARDERPIEC